MNTTTRLRNHTVARVTMRQLQQGHFSVCIKTPGSFSFKELIDALYDCSHGKCYMSASVTGECFHFSDSGDSVGVHTIICRKVSSFLHPLDILEQAHLSLPTRKSSLCFAAWCQEVWKDKTIVFPHEPVLVDKVPCTLTVVGTENARYVLLVDTQFDWGEASFEGDVYVAGRE